MGFTSPSVLRHRSYEMEVLIEKDDYTYVLATVLYQRDDQEVLHPGAKCSNKHTPAECNHEIYVKELMTIIKVLEEWRPECEATAHHLQLITDYNNL
jgi:hypothetical protein